MIYVWPYFQLNLFKRYFWIGDLIHFRFYFYILSKTAWGKFVEISSILKSKSTRGNYEIDSTWKFPREFDFQNRQNIKKFSMWIFLFCFDVESTQLLFLLLHSIVFEHFLLCPMDTSTWNFHQFRRENLLENCEIYSTWIRLSKSTKYQWFLGKGFDVEWT